MKRNLIKFIATVILALSMATSVIAAPEHFYIPGLKQMAAINYKFPKEINVKLIKGKITDIRIIDGSWVLFIKTGEKQVLQYPLYSEDNGWMPYIKVGSNVEVRVDYGCDPLKRQAKIYKVGVSKAMYDKLENSKDKNTGVDAIIGMQSANSEGVKLIQYNYDQAVNLGVCTVVSKVPGKVNTYLVKNSKNSKMVVNLDVKGVTYNKNAQFGLHDHKVFFYEGTYKLNGVEYPYFVE